MKKIITFLLVILAMILPVTVLAAEEELINQEQSIEQQQTTLESNTIILRNTNFELSSAILIRDNDTKPGVLPGSFMWCNAASAEGQTAHSQIYISAEGTYSVWAITKDFTTNPGTRWGKVEIDGVKKDYAFNSNGSGKSETPYEGWMWEEGFSVELSEGWHTIDVVEWKGGFRLGAILLTNDETLNPNAVTSYVTELQIYEDNTSPTFEGELSFELGENSSMKVSWPGAEDTNLCGYNLFINDSAEPIVLASDVNEYVISGLKQLQTVLVKVEAFDAHGNKMELSARTLYSDMDVSEGVFSDAEENPVTSMNDFAEAGFATVSFAVENKTDSDKEILLAIAVYNKTTGRMVASKRSAITLSALQKSNAELGINLPDKVKNEPQEYYIYATIWNNANSIAPQTVGVEIGN